MSSRQTTSDEKVTGWCPRARFPPWSMEDKVWWCGAALLVTLFGIYSKLKAQWTSMATTASCSDMSSGLCLVGPSFIFQQDNDPKHTSRLRKGCLTTKESCGRWSGLQSPDLNPIKMIWDEMDRRVKAEGEQVLSISGNSLQTVIQWLPHEAHWENAKSVQSCNQSKGWLLWWI